MGASIGLALAASGAYGATEFLAGVVSRRVPPDMLAFWSQVVAGLIITPLVLVLGGPFDGPAMAWGTAAGIAGGFGVITFYRALALGPTILVTPIVAAGSAIPTALGIVQGTIGGPLTLGGLAAVLVGIGLVSFAIASDSGNPLPVPTRGARSPELTPIPAARRASLPALGLALATAGLFGVFFILLGQGTEQNPAAAWWVTLGVEIGAVPTLLAVMLVTQRGKNLLPLWPRAILVATLAIGAVEVFADLALTLATAEGEVGIVSLLASLSPPVTAVLAFIISRERLTWLQGIGVLVAAAGVLLVAAGS